MAVLVRVDPGRQSTGDDLEGVGRSAAAPRQILVVCVAECIAGQSCRRARDRGTPRRIDNEEVVRRDGDEFLRLAPKVPVQTRPLSYPLEQANQALDDLRAGRLQGAAVLIT